MYVNSSPYDDLNFLVTEVSPVLNRFKRKSSEVYEFRCPICGDSAKSKMKARGYIYVYRGAVMFKCHNCQESLSFKNFLYQVDEALYAEYKKRMLDDKLFKSYAKPESDVENYVKLKETYAQIESVTKFKKVCKSVKELIKAELYEHPVLRYIMRRKIKRLDNLYYVESGKELGVLAKKYEKFCSYLRDTRLIFPSYNTRGEISNIKCRTLLPDSEEQRYINLRINEREDAVVDELPYGYIAEKIENSDGPVYVTEGEIDSLMVENGLAVGSSDLYNVFVPNDGVRDRLVFAYDNEPVSREITKMVRKSVLRGEKVVIYPRGMKAKDLNEYVVSGESLGPVADMLAANTYQGISAEVELANWMQR